MAYLTLPDGGVATFSGSPEYIAEQMEQTLANWYAAKQGQANPAQGSATEAIDAAMAEAQSGPSTTSLMKDEDAALADATPSAAPSGSPSALDTQLNTLPVATS